MERNDPGCVVIDEIAGIMVAFWGIEFNALTAITGFFIFRFFDILKPFPIRHIEKRLKGGLGIVMDDVLAGVFGNILLRLILYLISR